MIRAETIGGALLEGDRVPELLSCLGDTRCETDMQRDSRVVWHELQEGFAGVRLPGRSLNASHLLLRCCQAVAGGCEGTALWLRAPALCFGGAPKYAARLHAGPVISVAEGDEQSQPRGDWEYDAVSEVPGGPFDGCLVLPDSQRQEPRQACRERQHAWKCVGFPLACICFGVIVELEEV